MHTLLDKKCIEKSNTYHNFDSSNARIAITIPVSFSGCRPEWTAYRKTLQLVLLLDVC